MTHGQVSGYGQLRNRETVDFFSEWFVLVETLGQLRTFCLTLKCSTRSGTLQFSRVHPYVSFVASTWEYFCKSGAAFCTALEGHVKERQPGASLIWRRCHILPTFPKPFGWLECPWLVLSMLMLTKKQSSKQPITRKQTKNAEYKRTNSDVFMFMLQDLHSRLLFAAVFAGLRTTPPLSILCEQRSCDICWD